ncbi:MAG: hypothetical protein ACLTYW_01725 [Collinsella sp.]
MKQQALADLLKVQTETSGDVQDHVRSRCGVRLLDPPLHEFLIILASSRSPSPRRRSLAPARRSSPPCVPAYVASTAWSSPT